VAVVVACSSSTPGDKYPSVDSFCDALAAAECQEAANCDLDLTACKTFRKPLCLSSAAGAQGTGRTYTPSKGPDCVDLATKVWGSNNVAPADIASVTDTCARVFQGSIAANHSCSSNATPTADEAAQDSLKCTGDLICDKTLCGTKVVKHAGEGCANPGEVCDTGYYCTGSPAVTCTPKLQANQPCSVSAPCLESLRCVTGTCQPRADLGGACASDDDCTTGFCDKYNGYKCGKALIFAPAETVLCGNYGGPQVDAGQPPVTTPDAGGSDAASD
jgi:hypothetical protein